VARLAHVGALVVGDRGLTGADALERGEHAARVRGDPHVHHRVGAAGVDATSARPGRIDEADDLRHAVLVAIPAEVAVVVPLHQRAGPVDQLGVVGRPRRRDEHRPREDALIALDRVDERLGLRGVEDHVVLDERRLDVVLAARPGVADRGVAIGDRCCDIGPPREIDERVLDELGRAGLLLGCHAFDARQVDGLRGIPRPRPRGRGRRIVVGVGRRVGGCRVGAARPGCRSWRRCRPIRCRSCRAGARCCRRGRASCAVSPPSWSPGVAPRWCPRRLGVIVRRRPRRRRRGVHVGAAAHHRGDGQRRGARTGISTRGRRARCQPTSERRERSTLRRRHRATHRPQSANCGASAVSSPVDPRDARHPRGHPPPTAMAFTGDRRGSDPIVLGAGLQSPAPSWAPRPPRTCARDRDARRGYRSQRHARRRRRSTRQRRC
jgi:hypothetical protein